MTDRRDLGAHLKRMMEESEARRQGRIADRVRDMETLNARFDRFATISQAWLEQAVVPRFRTMTTVFPHAKASGARTADATLRLDATDEFPASAEVTVSFVLDPTADKVHVLFHARIIPVLTRFDKEGTLELDLEEEAQQQLGAFLDDRLCRFAEEYLRIREPDSPYQKDQRVVDPVCGMTLHRWEAAAVVRRGRDTHYFCVDECRRRFEENPERYGATGRA